MRHPIKVADSISALAFTSVCVSVHLLSALQKVNNPHDQGMGLLFTAFFFFSFFEIAVTIIGPMRQLELQAE